MDTTFQEELHAVLKLLIEPIAAEPNIQISKEGDQWRVNVNTDQNDLLVGYKGENIKAIQHVTRVLIHKKFPDNRTHFLIDVGKYRKSREHVLNATIQNMADKDVLEQGKTIIITGLTSYERRMVHNLLTEIKGLETTSIGEEGTRKLIIRPTQGEIVGSMGMDNAIIVSIDQLISDFEAIHGKVDENPEAQIS
jgi:spoIIIJ-associated protein